MSILFFELYFVPFLSYSRPMKVDNLLSKHDAFKTPQGLKNSLGDDFLLKNNSLFYTVRLKTLDLGFEFSEDFNPSYLSLPMAQLESILESKKIPYSDNVSALKKLNQNTGKNLEWDHIVDGLKANYVFHESCHALARNTSRNLKINTSQLQNKIVTILIEESFANACEFLLIAEAHDVPHRLFLEKNSYFTVFEDRTHLKNAIDKFSLGAVFQFMLFCYLHSNFLREQLTENDFKKILSLCDFKTVPEIKVLKSLAQNAFALNPRFRYTTTEMYLRLNGLPMKVTEALNFDCFSVIASNQELKRLISNLTLIITQ